MKKLLSILLTFVMVFSFVGMTASAAKQQELGSITVNGVSESGTYKIYKLLDLESYDTNGKGAYSYIVNSAWKDFFVDNQNPDVVDAMDYVVFDTTGKYVSWKEGVSDSAAAEFAKLALDYAKNNTDKVFPVGSSEDSTNVSIEGSTLKFKELTLGYYLIDSTVGTLCGLTTTNPNASINAKNQAPTIDKQVLEDSTKQWGGNDTADIGQIIDYRVTINVHAGAENYVLHDTMGNGLTFKNVSKIEHVIPNVETHELKLNTDYTVVTDGITDGCSFEIVFAKSFCDHLNTNDKVIVYYNAMLNRNAIIAGEGNDNIAKLSFGEGHETETDSVKTKTFGIDIVKTDSQNTLIDGAEFKIYDAETGGNEVKVVLTDDETAYRRAREDETGVSIVVKAGKVRVVGFDNGTYYLEETVTPNGYNKLTTRQKFIISDANLDAVFNGNTFSTGSGVHVVNKTGNMLPETGSIGTTAFITFGSIVALATGVLLVTKKRMSMIDD